MKLTRKDVLNLKIGDLFYYEVQDFDENVTRGIIEMVKIGDYDQRVGRVVWSNSSRDMVGKVFSLELYEMENGRARAYRDEKDMIEYVFLKA